MRRSLIAALSMLLVSTALMAQKIQFSDKGELKIVQFTDVHYMFGKEPSKLSAECIESILDGEKPDLVVLTGDIVVKEPIERGWDEITKLFIDRGIPYATTLGNHDDEGDLSREELARLLENYPLSLFKATVKGTEGYGNYTVPIIGRDGKSISTVLYCLDSRSYSTIEGIKGYGWFDFSQIAWYRDQSKRVSSKGLRNRGLAFFHIPLPEHKEAFDAADNSENIGQRREKECAPKINTGMFAAMVEMGDVRSISVGHDHINNYVAQKDSIALCYGAFSGSDNTYGYDDRVNGARIFILKEGEDRFETYIRLMDGTIKDRAYIPQ